jgi:hypothetical protein
MTDLPLHTAAHIAREAKLLDECRELEAQLYGKRIELALHSGCRDDATYWRERMEKVVKDRRDAALGIAEAKGECFFVAAGQHDAQQIRQGSAAHA